MKNLYILSSGLLRVEEMSLVFLRRLLRDCPVPRSNIHWTGVFWDEENTLAKKEKLAVLDKNGCSYTLIEPLKKELIDNWGRRVHPQPDHLLASGISQYYCKAELLRLFMATHGSRVTADDIFIYFRPDTIVTARYVRSAGARLSTFPSWPQILDVMNGKKNHLLLPQTSSDTALFEKSNNVLTDNFFFCDYLGLQSALDIYSRLEDLCPTTTDEGDGERKVIYHHRIAYNALKSRGSSAAILKCSMALVVDGVVLPV